MPHIADEETKAQLEKLHNLLKSSDVASARAKIHTQAGLSASGAWAPGPRAPLCPGRWTLPTPRCKSSHTSAHTLTLLKTELMLCLWVYSLLLSTLLPAPLTSASPCVWSTPIARTRCPLSSGPSYLSPSMSPLSLRRKF